MISRSTRRLSLWLIPYQRIIEMGEPVVPLVLAEFRRDPDHWFRALEAITGENPVPPETAGDVSRMAQAWLRWDEEQGIMAQEG